MPCVQPNRWRSPVIILAALLVTAMLTGCSTRALMAPDGGAIYWGTDSQTPNRIATSDLSSQALPNLAGTSPMRAGFLSPDGSIAYVVLADGNLTRVALPEGREIGPSIATGLGALGNNAPIAAIAPDGRTAILGAVSPSTGTLYRIDLETMTPLASAVVTSRDFVETVAYTPDGAHLLIATLDGSTQSASVIKVRTSDLAVVGGPTLLGGIDTGTTRGLVLSLDGSTGYAIANRVTVRFDVATMTVTGDFTYETNFGVEPGTIVRSPAGTRAYFATNNQPATFVTLDLEGMRWLDFEWLNGLPTSGVLDLWNVLSPGGTTAYVGDENGATERIEVGTTNPLDLEVAGPGAIRTSRHVTCTSNCRYDLLDFETVTLTATADDGATFTGWSDVCSGSEATCSLPMDVARSVTATFVADPEPARLGVRRITARAGTTRIVFTTQLRVWEPGTITQRIVLRSGSRSRALRTLCRTSRTLTRADDTRLVCRSSRAARTLLARRTLRVSVVTTLRAEDGRTRRATRHLRLVRTAPRPVPPVTG